MSNEALGRLAASCIVAVLAGVALIGSASWSNSIIVLWLVYAIGCGALLNTKRGEKRSRLAMYSLAPALVPLVVLLFTVLAGRAETFSSVSVASDRFAWLLVFFVAVTWLGIFLFSFARSAVLGFLTWATNGKGSTWLSRAESTVRALIGLLSAVVLLMASLVN